MKIPLNKIPWKKVFGVIGTAALSMIVKEGGKRLFEPNINLETQIKKLRKMKKKSLIKEEEYDKMREKLINEAKNI